MCFSSCNRDYLIVRRCRKVPGPTQLFVVRAWESLGTRLFLSGVKSLRMDDMYNK